MWMSMAGVIVWLPGGNCYGVARRRMPWSWIFRTAKRWLF